MPLEKSQIEDAVSRIPSMGGRQIGEHLRQLAAQTTMDSCIVEVGAWLGAGTAQLALGAKNAEPVPDIHVFDHFHASESEVTKAAAAGVELKKGQDTRSVVESHLANLDASIHLHKGRIEEIRWEHGPIGLYVDDASKDVADFNHILRAFGPSWIAGETMLVLMDYGYWKKFAHDPAMEKRLRIQTDFITSNDDYFEMVNERPIKGTSAAIIKYVKPFDFSAVPAIARK